MSSAKMVASGTRSTSGTSPSTMRRARPSAIAVLPTPGSPTYSGLFFCAAAQDLDGALDLGLAADQRIDLAVRTAGLQDLPDLRRIDDREQQMLDGHEFVPRLARAGKRIIQAKFEFLTKHWLRLF
jgi:hypothetical protein